MPCARTSAAARPVNGLINEWYSSGREWLHLRVGQRSVTRAGRREPRSHIASHTALERARTGHARTGHALITPRRQACADRRAARAGLTAQHTAHTAADRGSRARMAGGRGAGGAPDRGKQQPHAWERSEHGERRQLARERRPGAACAARRHPAARWARSRGADHAGWGRRGAHHVGW